MINNNSYEQLPCLFSQNILNDKITFQPTDINPPFNVVTKYCDHFKQKGSATFDQAMSQIWQGKPYVCSCGKQARTQQELAQDLYGAIGLQFKENVTEVFIIQGVICHTYIRAKKYLDTLNNFQTQENKALIPDILQRYTEQNSITNLIKQIKNTGYQINSYWAYCLLDKVKINIPVRIIGCQHLECYELTSLLSKQEQYKQETNKKFPCEYTGCQSYLDMTNLQTITSKLTIDKDLLKILNQAAPTQFKFQFDFTNEQFITNNKKDEFILKYFEIYAQDKLQDQLYSSIQQHMKQILSEGGDDAKIKILLNEQKYVIREINLIDPFTQQIIEFPIRCIYCKDTTKCVDVRTMVADYELNYSRTKVYACPLCKSKIDISKQRTAKYLKGYFYLDQNLLSKMFKDQQNSNQKSFYYNGKQYMLEEFMYKNKLSKEDYIAQLMKQTNKSQIAEFKILNCINQPQKYLKYPLIIKDCPQENLVDFDSFYEEFQKKNYNIETEGIILCRCEQCNVNPIKKYHTQLFYHEALGFALQRSMIPKTPGTVLKFDFSTGTQFMEIKKFQSQTVSPTDLDKSVRMNNKGNMKQGFIDLLDDQEYQNLFRSVQLQGGRSFQVMSMQVDVMNGLSAQCNNEGMKADVEQKIQDMNKTANDSLKKWNFKVTGLEVKVLNFNTGIQSQQFQQRNPPK